MLENEFIFTADRRGESDYSCADGRIEMMKGARIYEDGSVGALPGIRAVEPEEAPAPLPPMQVPEVEFGLVRVAIPGSQYTFSDISAATLAKAASIDSMVMEAYGRHRDKITAAGAYGSPFFVRCALRLYDDSLVLASAPVQMLPWVLPPCLGVDVLSTAGGTSDLRVDLSEVRACALRLRLRSVPSPELASIVKSLEIYVTQPVALCSGSGDGYITRYGSVASGSVAGVYSADGVDFAVHTVSSLALEQMNVWSVGCPQGFERSLRSPGVFYHASTIPFAEMEVTAGFDVEVPRPDFTCAEVMPAVMELPPEPFLAKAVVEGRTYAVPERIKAPQALSLRGSMAFVGASNAGGAVASVVTVLSSREGTGIASRCIVFGRDLTQAFPFFIYHPDSCATLMEIKQNGVIWQLSLRPCGDGSAWWRMPDEPEPLRMSAGIDISNLPASIPAGNKLYVSPPGHALCMRRAEVRIGNSAVYALAPTAGTLSPGQLGTYILYAFAAGGIYAVNRDLSHATLISATGVWQGAMVQTMSGCTLCVTGRCMLVVKGLKVRMLALPATFCRIGVFADCLLLVGERSLLYNPENDSFAEIDGEVPEAWEEDEDSPMTVELYTRPLKCGDVGSMKTLRGVEVRGAVGRGKVSCAVYGSRDMLHWHLLASSRSRSFILTATTPCRAFRLRISARLLPTERLYAVRLTHT